MKSIKRGIITCKILFEYSFVNSILYILLIILSASLAPMGIYLLEKIIDSINTLHLTKITMLYGGLYILSLLLKNIFDSAQSYVCLSIQNDLYLKQTPQILSKFQKIKYPCFEKKEYQDMLERISNNPQNDILNSFTSMLSILYTLLYCIGSLIMFLRISLLLSIFAILISIPMYLLEAKSAKIEMDLRWTMTGDIRKRFYLQQLFVDRNALQEIKIFSFKNILLEMISNLNNNINKDLKKTITKSLIFSASGSLLLLIFIIGSSFFLLFKLFSLVISMGMFVSIFTSMFNYYSTLMQSISSVSRFLRLSVIIKYYEDFMDLPEKNTKNVSSLNNIVHEIEFNNVSFCYANSDKLVLDSISLKFNSNENIAFVGKNGSGKSTIIKLLCGLYEPTKGDIRIDGVDISSLSDKQKQAVFSVIFQDFQSYQLTLRENVAFGNIESINDDERILASLKKAEIIDILDKSNNGIDMNLGRIEDDSTDLSFGQWQRIAIARTYMSDASFMIMDEPTASLDPIAESKMFESFLGILKNKGTLIISHRLVSAILADRIYILDNGAIKEVGNHDCLLRKNGLYASMFNMQKTWYESEEVKNV